MAKPPAETAAKASFTEASKALETIVQRFKTETLPLEEALSLFEAGVGHIQTCQAKLTDVKGKVDVLVKSLGEPTVQPFDAE
jgi:exodeoxyribonuclease VII small subunit